MLLKFMYLLCTIGCFSIAYTAAVGLEEWAKVVADFYRWVPEAPSPADCLTLAYPEGHSEHRQAAGGNTKGFQTFPTRKTGAANPLWSMPAPIYSLILRISTSFISKLWQLRPGPLLNGRFHFQSGSRNSFLFLVPWVISGALQSSKILKSSSLAPVCEHLDSSPLPLCSPSPIRVGRLFCHGKEVLVLVGYNVSPTVWVSCLIHWMNTLAPKILLSAPR